MQSSEGGLHGVSHARVRAAPFILPRRNHTRRCFRRRGTIHGHAGKTRNSDQVFGILAGGVRSAQGAVKWKDLKGRGVRHFQAVAFLVPGAGLEPAQPCGRGILSPLCLPIPPHRRASAMIRIAHLLLAVKSFLPKPAKIYFISLRRFSPYFFQAPAYDRESAHAKEETQYGRHHPPRRRGRPDLPGGVDRQPALGGPP